MLIYCCGMYRSASTWIYQVTTDLVENHLQGKGIGFKTIGQLVNNFKKDTSNNVPKVVKIHTSDNSLLSLIRSHPYKIVYSHRDIRDVAVSLMAKFDRTLDYLLRDSGRLDKAVEDYYRWTSLENVLLCPYTDIVEHPSHVVMKIANHLGIEISDSQINELVDKYSKERQLERINKFNRSFTARYKRQLRSIGSLIQGGNLPSFAKRYVMWILHRFGYSRHIYDKRSQLHSNHIQSGEVGKWRSFFSSEEKKELTSKYWKWLVELGYETKGSYLL